ncbi:MAG: DUF1361 domain-containing protein [bacterium]|nr:DUF1361 domain-containing protein [bacterium]
MKYLSLISNSIRDRHRLIRLFSVIIAGCVALIGLRFIVHTDRTFLFLLWNFFLALIPLALSSLLLQMNQQKMKVSAMLFVGVCWMLFFPNAPYMLTDFIHIAYGHPHWMFLDILTISWFAVSALLAALISMNDVSNVLLSRYHRKRVSVMVLGLSMLAGFGIYLGRYLRFNSWDILHKPDVLFLQIGERLIDPFSYSKTWFITFGFGLLIYLIHIGLVYISKEINDQQKVKINK